jgi:putative membrane protein
MKFAAQILLAAASAATVPSIYAQSAAFSDEDKNFLSESAQENTAEVKLAELALRTSKNPVVVTFAKQVLDDHRKLLDETQPVAMKAGVASNPRLSGDANREYLKLAALSGDAFDKNYVRVMVNDQHRDLEAARAEHEKTRNEDVRKLAARAQEISAGDTEMADRIATKMGV